MDIRIDTKNKVVYFGEKPYTYEKVRKLSDKPDLEDRILDIIEMIENGIEII